MCDRNTVPIRRLPLIRFPRCSWSGLNLTSLIMWLTLAVTVMEVSVAA